VFEDFLYVFEDFLYVFERHWWSSADGTVLDYAESVEPGDHWRTRRYSVDTPAPTPGTQPPTTS